MKSYKKFIKDEEEFQGLVELFEHQRYKKIPNTSCSYREDSENTNTMTQRHSHIYVKPNGNGTQLYSVNKDGSGHDGSSGVKLPSSHADFFRSKGYKISLSNVLESVDLTDLDSSQFELIVLDD